MCLQGRGGQDHGEVPGDGAHSLRAKVQRMCVCVCVGGGLQGRGGQDRGEVPGDGAHPPQSQGTENGCVCVCVCVCVCGFTGEGARTMEKYLGMVHNPLRAKVQRICVCVCVCVCVYGFTGEGGQDRGELPGDGAYPPQSQGTENVCVWGGGGYRVSLDKHNNDGFVIHVLYWHRGVCLQREAG